MTLLTHSRISSIFGVAIISVALVYGGTVFASHNFEIGVSGNVLPDNTHIRLDGINLAPGAIFPIYDSSPNYVAGHLLLSAPCMPTLGDGHLPNSDKNKTWRPTITVIAGHIDEFDTNTRMDSIPLFYINTVSNGPKSCVFHAHLPDPINGGAPKVTDIALINTSNRNIIFDSEHVVDVNIQQVIGNIGHAPYENGPVINIGPNPVFDLNDNDSTNDGRGHPSQGGGGGH